MFCTLLIVSLLVSFTLVERFAAAVVAHVQKCSFSETRKESFVFSLLPAIHVQLRIYLCCFVKGILRHLRNIMLIMLQKRFLTYKFKDVYKRQLLPYERGADDGDALTPGYRGLKAKSKKKKKYI